MTTTTVAVHTTGDIDRAQYRLSVNPRTLQATDVEVLRSISPELGARAERAQKAAIPLPAAYWSHGISFTAEEKLKTDPASLTDIEIQHLAWDDPLRGAKAAESRHAAIHAREIAAKAPRAEPAPEKVPSAREFLWMKSLEVPAVAEAFDAAIWSAATEHFTLEPQMMTDAEVSMLRLINEDDGITAQAQRHGWRKTRSHASLRQSEFFMAWDCIHLILGQHAFAVRAERKRLTEAERTIAELTSEIAILKAQTKGLNYRGTYEPGFTYERNNLVTWDGGMWIAKEQTHAKPGDSAPAARAWQLCVARGRPGKDGRTRDDPR